jgi:hypothetical protein
MEIASHWAPIVKAAGMYHPSQDAGNLFLLAGSIMHDPEVRKRFMARMNSWLPPEGRETCPPADDYYVGVLNAMTPAEKNALKARIRERHPGKSAPR